MKRIGFDTWPGLDPFIEIEGNSIDAVKQASKELGLKVKDAYLGSVTNLINEKFGISHEIINTIPEISFKNPFNPKLY